MYRLIITILMSLCCCNLYASWHTVTNDQFGFSISYPANLKPQTTFSRTYLMDQYWTSVENNLPNKVNHSIIEIPIALVNLDENLSSISNAPYYYAAVRIGTSSAPAATKNCIVPPYEPEKAYTTSINGKVFHVLTIDDYAMGQYRKGQSYRILHNGFCYAVEFVETGSNICGCNKQNVNKIMRVRKQSKKIAIQMIKTFYFIQNR
ncbi:MAG: hypothetical protein PVI75_01560 [Gammaproteobacteria bacterium]|jgi:hypothetical protein